MVFVRTRFRRGRSRLTDCRSAGNVSGGSNVGGLVGWNSGTVTDCRCTDGENPAENPHRSLTAPGGAGIINCMAGRALRRWQRWSTVGQGPKCCAGDPVTRLHLEKRGHDEKRGGCGKQETMAEGDGLAPFRGSGLVRAGDDAERLFLAASGRDRQRGQSKARSDTAAE